MSHVRIAVAQLNTVVGDLQGNADLILSTLNDAEADGADLCIFSELTITGYPPEDLLLKPGFVADNVRCLNDLASMTSRCAAVVGFVEPLDSPRHRLANAAAVCSQGKVVGVYRKRLLPNYGVFDEQRWFTPGTGDYTFYSVAGCLVGISICEDVWFPDGPVVDQGLTGADIVVNLNASPYSRSRRSERLAMLKRRAVESHAAIAYVNQVGGQDELVFDGASLVVGSDGALLAAGRQFEPDLFVVDITPARGDSGRASSKTGNLEARVVALGENVKNSGTRRGVLQEPLCEIAEVYDALVLGTRDYMKKNGFSDALVGLSGGIDSSLVATIAVDAVGKSHVHGLSMPSRYSSRGSLEDASELAKRLGIELLCAPIEPSHSVLSDTLDGILGHQPTGLTDENLQSRLRGIILMGVSNANGWIVLTTGNKSEMATGYSTLYGDTAGGFAVIKDVSKTLVYALCRYRNQVTLDRRQRSPIPDTVLDKPPSAELRPDQRDDESLPPYDELDPILAAYVEQDQTANDLVESGFDRALVSQVVRLVDGAEYKRRQMPPGVRISVKAFGKDRRMPITNHYDRCVQDASQSNPRPCERA